MSNSIKCTVGPSAVTGERCGKPAVATLVGRNGELFGECADHVSDHVLFGDIVFVGTFEVSA